MTELFELASKLGGAPLATVLIFMMAVVIVTSMRGDWVWKREIAAKDLEIAGLKQERDEWKGLALARREVVEDAVVDLASNVKRRRP